MVYVKYIRAHVPTGKESLNETVFLSQKVFEYQLEGWNRFMPQLWQYRVIETRRATFEEQDTILFPKSREVQKNQK